MACHVDVQKVVLFANQRGEHEAEQQQGNIRQYLQRLAGIDQQSCSGGQQCSLGQFGKAVLREAHIGKVERLEVDPLGQGGDK